MSKRSNTKLFIVGGIALIIVGITLLFVTGSCKSHKMDGGLPPVHNPTPGDL